MGRGCLLGNGKLCLYMKILNVKNAIGIIPGVPLASHSMS